MGVQVNELTSRNGKIVKYSIWIRNKKSVLFVGWTHYDKGTRANEFFDRNRASIRTVVRLYDESGGWYISVADGMKTLKYWLRGRQWTNEPSA